MNRYFKKSYTNVNYIMKIGNVMQETRKYINEVKRKRYVTDTEAASNLFSAFRNEWCGYANKFLIYLTDHKFLKKTIPTVHALNS